MLGRGSSGAAADLCPPRIRVDGPARSLSLRRARTTAPVRVLGPRSPRAHRERQSSNLPNSHGRPRQIAMYPMRTSTTTMTAIRTIHPIMCGTSPTPHLRGSTTGSGGDGSAVETCPAPFRPRLDSLPRSREGGRPERRRSSRWPRGRPRHGGRLDWDPRRSPCSTSAYVPPITDEKATLGVNLPLNGSGRTNLPAMEEGMALRERRTRRFGRDQPSTRRICELRQECPDHQCVANEQR